MIANGDEGALGDGGGKLPNSTGGWNDWLFWKLDVDGGLCFSTNLPPSGP